MCGAQKTSLPRVSHVLASHLCFLLNTLQKIQRKSGNGRCPCRSLKFSEWLVSILSVFLWLPRVRLTSDGRKIRALPSRCDFFQPGFQWKQRAYSPLSHHPSLWTHDPIEANLLRGWDLEGDLVSKTLSKTRGERRGLTMQRRSWAKYRSSHARGHLTSAQLQMCSRLHAPRAAGLLFLAQFLLSSATGSALTNTSSFSKALRLSCIVRTVLTRFTNTTSFRSLCSTAVCDFKRAQ